MNPNESLGPDKIIEDERSFGQKKHEKWNTPIDIINSIIVEATGSAIVSKEKVILGETNEVYSAVTESGQEVIIRLFHGEKNRFEKERWALEECAKLGIIVPKILLLKRLEIDNMPIQVCIETRLPGVGLDTLHYGANSEELMDILKQLGEILTKVHSIKTNGFGVLDKYGNGLFPSVDKLIPGDLFIDKDKILPTFEGKPAESKIILWAYEILVNESGQHSKAASRLIHNDLSPTHILVDNGKISGIIDFESACGADPMQEFALWEFKFRKDYPLKFIQAGYGEQSMFSGDYEKKLNFWIIYRALTSLRYCIKESKQAGIDRAIRVLSEAEKSF